MAKYKCAGRLRRDEEGDPYCTHEADRPWKGRCPGCNRFYSCDKVGADKASRSSFTSLASMKPPPRLKTGFKGLDYVLGANDPDGGGIPKGACILISAPGGTGKSTMMVQVANFVSQHHKRGAVYASGEQSDVGLAEIVRRIGTVHEGVRVMSNECNVYKVTDECEADKPELLVIDSLGTASVPDSSADEGSAEQQRAVMQHITAWVLREKVTVIVIAHVNKDGDLAGPEQVKHLVDIVLELDPVLDDEGQQVRVSCENCDVEGSVCGADRHRHKLLHLRSMSKNRFGPTGVDAYFKMTNKGIEPAEKPDDKKKSRIIDPSSPEGRDSRKVVDIAGELLKRQKKKDDNGGKGGK